MRTRWSAYAGVSAALAGGVIVKALAQRPNFYSAAVYLAQSSANLMILTNFIFVTACTILIGLQKLLYGPLRPIEIEQLYEKAWFAVTETCLAMTIFRGEIGAWFLVMFFALLAGKVWTWIGEGRVEILEQQPPRNPRLFHTRLALSLALSVCFDLTMLEYVVKQVMHMPKPDMMVMFGFEFAVLSIVSLSTAARYAINLIEIIIVRKQKAKRIDEIRRERITSAVREAEQAAQQSPEHEGAAATSTTVSDTATVPTRALEAARQALLQPIDEQEIEVEGWEGKGRWIFYLDLATDFFKLVVYLSFFFILLIFYGLPIHILRDVFMTFRSFFKRIGDFMRYRTATRDMNARYPDATEQEIGREDVCIICREEMRPYQPPANGERANPVAERMRPKKLPCGHVLHFSCLRSWLERQQICPTCRTNVVARPSTRTGTNNAGADGGAAQNGNAPPAERQGPRIFQWGPLRIGIGAARGNVLEDLQQQLGDGQQRPAQQPQADGPQQYGFGIRWDGLRRRDRRDRDRGDRGDRGQQSIQRQLDDVQRQINQEYRALGQMTNELRLLRNMEAELTRIRAQREGGSTTAPAVPQQAGSNPPMVHALTGNTQHVVPAGSDQLPAGVTLPDGWSLMPLHPLPSILQPALGQIGQGVAGMPGQLPQSHFGIPNSLPFPGDMQIQHQALPFPNNQPNQHGQLQSWLPSNTVNSFQLPPPIVPNNRDLNNQSGIGQTRNIFARPLQQPEQARNILHTSNSATTSTPNLSQMHNTHPNQSIAQPSPRPPSASAQSFLNGLNNRGANTPSQTMVNGTDDPPVASMYTLPSWGSAAMEPSTSNRVMSDTGEFNTDVNRTNNNVAMENGSTNNTLTDDPSTSSRRNKNPTVEDFAEDPD